MRKVLVDANGGEGGGVCDVGACVSQGLCLASGAAMSRSKKKPTERLPWYRARGYKGDITENEKRQLDAFRMQKEHPAASYDSLPKEVRMYMIKIGMELYDKKQESLDHMFA